MTWYKCEDDNLMSSRDVLPSYDIVQMPIGDDGDGPADARSFGQSRESRILAPRTAVDADAVVEGEGGRGVFSTFRPLNIGFPEV